jgi:phosphoribulokinase
MTDAPSLTVQIWAIKWAREHARETARRTHEREGVTEHLLRALEAAEETLITLDMDEFGRATLR